jgi:DNA-binding NarL/FixJ family response regulator
MSAICQDHSFGVWTSNVRLRPIADIDAAGTNDAAVCSARVFARLLPTPKLQEFPHEGEGTLMIVSRASSRGDVKRIMLVDDHTVVRRGVRALIERVPGWEVCAEASNGGDAIELAAETRPDFLIMDISMPGLSGIDATVEIRKILPQIEVLILTMHESDRMAGQALRAGARGYMIKNESEDRLMEALEALSRGQIYFSAERVGDAAPRLPALEAKPRPRAADPSRAAGRQAGRRGQVEQGDRLYTQSQHQDDRDTPRNGNGEDRR